MRIFWSTRESILNPFRSRILIEKTIVLHSLTATGNNGKGDVGCSSMLGRHDKPKYQSRPVAAHSLTYLICDVSCFFVFHHFFLLTTHIHTRLQAFIAFPQHSLQQARQTTQCVRIRERGACSLPSFLESVSLSCFQRSTNAFSLPGSVVHHVSQRPHHR